MINAIKAYKKIWMLVENEQLKPVEGENDKT